MDNNNRVNTDNKGWLDTEEGFKSLRGIQNKGALMGYAKDKEDKRYEIYPASCNLGRCFCWATAVKVKKL